MSVTFGIAGLALILSTGEWLPMHTRIVLVAGGLVYMVGGFVEMFS